MISQRGKANASPSKSNPARGGAGKSAGRPRATVRPSERAVLKTASKESHEDRLVLAAFRKFLMAPGEMLCFAGNEAVAMRSALQRLTSRGMLVAEKFPGAYSLTSAGFAMMQAKD